MNNNSDFNFWMPLDIEKSGEGKQVMRIKGIASTAHVDTDEETLEPSGFVLDRLTKSGYFNYDHRSRENPMYIVGEPDVAKIVGGKLYVEGNLYDTPLGKNIWEFANVLKKSGSKRQLGFSIEGKALERDPLNQKRITKALLTGIAITPSPKNSNTLMDIVKGEKSEMFIDYEFDIEKSLSGSDVILEKIDNDSGFVYYIDKDLKVEKQPISEIRKSIDTLLKAAKQGLLNKKEIEKFKTSLIKLNNDK